MSNAFVSHGGCFTEMESSVVWAVYLQVLMPGAVTSKHINPRSLVQTLAYCDQTSLDNVLRVPRVVSGSL